MNQDVYITDLDKGNAAPIVTLLYTTREHYDILYPRWSFELVSTKKTRCTDLMDSMCHHVKNKKEVKGPELYSFVGALKLLSKCLLEYVVKYIHFA
jgi:hypothetical protein